MKNDTLINLGKLREDVDSVNKILKEKDGLTLSKRLDRARIGNAAFSNALSALEENKNIDVTLYEDCDKKGLIAGMRLFAICNLFGLDGDDYILKLKKKTGNKSNGNEPDERIIEYIRDKNIIDKFIERAEKIQHSTSNNDMHTMQILSLLEEKSNRLDEWYKLFSEQLSQTDRNTNDIKKIVEYVEKLGRIEVQNMEYLKSIAEGIQLLNERLGKQ